LHFLIMWTVATPVDSPLKKPLMKLTSKLSAALDRPWIKLSGIGALLSICGTSLSGGAWDDVTMRTRFCAAVFSLLSVPLYMKLSHFNMTVGEERLLELELEFANVDMLKWVPPPLATVNVLMAPIQQFLNVEVLGLDNVPTDYPCFYVMNHSLMGIEMPSFVHLLYKERGVFVRGLADHFHWAGPQGPLLRALGAVDGTRPNVDMLMARRQSILVYPGGGAEIMKASSVERYALMWKERLGFARMAIKNRYPILPCACVGTEDMLDIMFDLPMGFLSKPLGVPSIPMVKPNSIQKIYFWFGKPIPTDKYGGDSDNTDFAREVRDLTKAAIEGGIREMRAKQAADPDRYFIDRAAKRIREVQSKADESFRTLLASVKSD